MPLRIIGVINGGEVEMRGFDELLSVRNERAAVVNNNMTIRRPEGRGREDRFKD